MTKSFVLLFVAVSLAAQAPRTDLGYTDTPMLPGLPYHVHDPARPHPAVVTPGLHAGDAPSDALVLFDGRDLSHWMSTKDAWKVENDYVEVVPNAADIRTKETFGDVQLHVEWAAPAAAQQPPESRQQRHRPSWALRSVGTRFVRRPDVRRWTGWRDLRAMATS